MTATPHASRDAGEPGRTDALVLAAFARLDAIALGCAFGALFGLLVFLATIVLVAKGGEAIGPRLGLLAQYFIGYSVTPGGSVVGLLYGFGLGFGIGWLLASLRNLCLRIYLYGIRLRTQLSSIHDLLDPE